jgi:hypothetical protein
MLTLLAEQIEEVRRRIDEAKAAKISNNYIIRALHDGAVKLARELYLTTDDVTAFNTVAAQQGYALPLDFIDTSDVIWQYDVSHYPLTRLDKKALLQSLPQQGDPSYYAVDEARKLLLFDPIPQSAAVTSTLSSGISATDVTIPVVSTTGFGGMGYITIGSEIIQYTAITATSFTGCVRGACNTVVAAHLTSVTVTWNDITLYYTRLPKQCKHIRTTDLVTVTNASAVVVGVGTNWVSGQNIYPGQYLGLGGLSTVNTNETFPLTWYKILSIDTTTQLTLTAPFAESTVASSACIISDMDELYEQNCSIPVAWAVYLCEGILGNSEKKENARLAFNSEMALAKERLNGPDNLLVIRRSKFAQNMDKQIIRAPAHYESFQD